MRDGRELLESDITFRKSLEAALSTPRGYAYVRTAVTAAILGNSLATTWRNHGQQLLDDMLRQLAREAPDELTPEEERA